MGHQWISRILHNDASFCFTNFICRHYDIIPCRTRILIHLQ
nr:MAG TPA: hypothetical protein [Caudoviricetes sp.]